MEGVHKPVLLKEVLEELKVKDGNWYIDATLGDGGHSLEILKAGGKVLGIDVDPEAIKRAGKRFEKEKILTERWELINGNFRDIRELVENKKFAGVLFDLGVSSLQLEDPKRGFSFMREGPLDMRMDPSLAVTAADLLKVFKKGELSELFSNLGEEKRAWAMASALERSGEIRTTSQLSKLAERVVSRKRSGIHPATRIFQALRIAVNDELNALKEALPQALEVVSEGGRILIISFHSLEDRIVKHTFREWEGQGLGMVATRKPISPSDDELKRNPRSRSAKMRVFQMR